MRDWDAFGLLRIGSSITIGSQFLPKYVKEFYTRYPETEVKALVAPSKQLERKIMENKLDFVLIEGIPHHLSQRKIPDILSQSFYRTVP